MGIGPGQRVPRAVGWAREWQRLSLAAIDQAMGHYLRGCATVAMARTPQQALAALHKTQTSLLRDSADTVAQVTWLWRKQNTELFVIRAEHAPAPQSQPAQATAVEVEY